MKRPALFAHPGGIADEAARAPTSLRGLLDDREIDEIERTWPDGLTSRQIVDVFETRGIRFSEATLRKYVQLGLLPRSVRVGRKGKHRGSCGLYPSHVIRRVNVVKGMMAEDRTIEEIQRSFARFKDEIESVEKDLRDLIAGFEREAKAPRVARRRAPRAGARDYRGEAGRRRVGPSDQQPRATNFAHAEPHRAAERRAAGATSIDRGRADRPRRRPMDDGRDDDDPRRELRRRRCAATRGGADSSQGALGGARRPRALEDDRAQAPDARRAAAVELLVYPTRWSGRCARNARGCRARARS